MHKLFKMKWLFVVALAAILGIAAQAPTEKYFDIARNLDIFATLLKEVNSYYVDDVNPNRMVKSGIDAMLNTLDPYTNYIPEDEIENYRTMTTGMYGGIGAVIGRRKDRNIILMPYNGFPADKAGLKIGDEILEIDGFDVKKKNSAEVSKLLKGQAGTKVKLKVVKLGKTEPEIIEFQRERIKVDNVPYFGMVSGNIGYIQLSEFTSDASREVKKGIEDLKAKGATKLIFDLRDNPGGLLNEAVNISNLFIPKDKLVVNTKGKVAEWVKEYKALNPPFDTEIPIAVLISGKSASASEIVSGVLQDYDRGVLIGQKSYGKGLVQTTRPLTYNSQLKVTTAKYYIPSGRCIQAIDYSNRGSDGTVKKFADSLRMAFKTSNGRVVYDGGGVSPDVEVKRESYAQITSSLISKDLIFDYASVYYLAHPKIVPAKEFQLSDAEYNDFVTWLKDKEYDYTTKVETSIKDLAAAAQKEKYYDEIKVQLDALKTRMAHNKEHDLEKNKDEIREVLEHEIVSRYYFEKGVKEAGFDDDPEVKEAIRVLNDTGLYQKILSGK
ncbi:MAG TPA: S41 family peptidase [Catalimonadaceae bacterium]|nr:S41 family peptidase [Catalimonadaceae bacterium]